MKQANIILSVARYIGTRIILVLHSCQSAARHTHKHSAKILPIWPMHPWYLFPWTARNWKRETGNMWKTPKGLLDYRGPGSVYSPWWLCPPFMHGQRYSVVIATSVTWSNKPRPPAKFRPRLPCTMAEQNTDREGGSNLLTEGKLTITD